jgi:hypothetical protein
MDALLERLVKLLGGDDFLAMKGLANEVPLFIQTYEPAQEDALRRMVGSLTQRLRNAGLTVVTLDLFDIVLQILEERNLLGDLLEGEPTFEKVELLETLNNYSDPNNHLVPRLLEEIGKEGTQLTLITGAGRVYPFLRTHTVLESLQPRMPCHPVVLFFPGEYIYDPERGSQLRLFGKAPSPVLYNPYYRAHNLNDFHI